MSNYEALEHIRKTELGLSQEDIANKIQCDPKTLRKIMKGIKDGEDVNVQMYYVVRLADLYKVSIDFLLGRSNHRHVETEAIHDITGLSEYAIEVLRYINTLKSDKWDASNIADHNRRVIRATNDLLESIDIEANIQAGRKWDGLDPMHSALNSIWFYLHSSEVKTSGLTEYERTDGGILQFVDFSFGPNDYDRHATISEVYRAYIQKELVKSLDYVAENIEGKKDAEDGKH